MLITAQVPLRPEQVQFLPNNYLAEGLNFGCEIQVNLDSYSAPFLVTQVIGLLQEAKWVILVVLADQPGLPLQALSPLIETFLRAPQPKLLVMQGRHLQLEKLGERLGAQFRKINNTIEGHSAIQQFLAGCITAKV